MIISIKQTAVCILTLFSIVAPGLLIGRIQVHGVGLGTAAIFLTGMIAGHFGAELPEDLQTLGRIMFITSVGISSGQGFFQRLRKNGAAYAVICAVTAATGAVLCYAAIRLLHIEAPLVTGLMTGSFTTAPGFAAAKEAVSDIPEAVTQVATGFGIAYPVGVICKVLSIQIIPLLVHADMQKERELIALAPTEKRTQMYRLFSVDQTGLFPVSAAAVLGIALGSVAIPLPGGGKFALGTTGGPLIAALLLAQLGHIGPIRLTAPKENLAVLREVGLMISFAGAGVEGGKGLVEILLQWGPSLLFISLLLVLIPLAAGFLVSRVVLKLPLLNGLGAMTASMTCTPSLAALIRMSGTDDVAAAYGTTYPIAMILLILITQVLVKL